MPTPGPGRKSLLDMGRRGRPFLKMHGLRNHFVIVDGRAEPFEPDTDEIVRICDPQAGVGADQLVVIETPGDAGAARQAAAFARFWNTDGREVEACGNATRCVGWLLCEEARRDEVAIETRAGVLACQRVGPWCMRTGMGRISMDWRDDPLAEERDTCHLDREWGPLKDPAALSVGNPHLVFFVDDAAAVDLEGLAPDIQADPLFPRQVNVGVAQMLSERSIRLRVYERGAGLTMACGSGACAAAFAALARGLTDSRSLSVELPGGTLEVEIGRDGSAAITGEVALSFSGYLPHERRGGT
jgi:diaminopimelate epimerase